MAIRFDAGEIRKHEFTDEGYFRAEAVFARDGILEYRTPDGGVRRELRTPEANKKALTGFGLKPISLEHPPVLIDSLNAKEYSVGLSDSTVFYDPSGFVRGVITVLDSVAVNSIREKKTLQISAGYKCNIDPTPGVWQGQRYDAIQTDLEINHIALTQKGRAGDNVKICLDGSDDPDIAFEVRRRKSDGIGEENEPQRPPSSLFLPRSSTNKKPMARVTIDSVEYEDVPENFAFVTSQKIKELEAIRSRADSLESEKQSALARITELEKQFQEIEEERDRALGRADGYEEIANSAVPVLEEHGYVWDSDAAEFVADSKAKKLLTQDPEEEEEDEEEETDETDVEEMTETHKGKKPWMKKAAKKDSVSNILSAWKKAQTLGIEEERFDSELDADEVRRLALSELMPDVDISGYSPAWVEGLFDAAYLQSLEQEEESRTDSVSPNLQDLVKIARTPTRATTNAAAEERSREIENAWQQPLSLSR
ncbi:DUF2213 domain-containing protein [Nostoc sp. CHAB 5836]|uniref:DUF2213 domain-containing protein n=1 Tax=Nostoc sp. CHAB 5836 TaxID=2780404 RepID=UPI001E472FDA|nr:DUF2213 domain-containing protein [Nostoc sp. CHAB 5836]MCC5618177.1 DUF2213 domain-containing protein [Nostoc sp. CHAB 5836]